MTTVAWDVYACDVQNILEASTGSKDVNNASVCELFEYLLAI